MSIYPYSAISMDGNEINFGDFAGKVLLIVNTASKCGFTKQFAELQLLYEKYESEDFTVLGFPCNQFRNQEPGNEDEIRSFCQKNYGVTFPMFMKVDVKGKEIHPIFAYLTAQSKGFLTSGIKWNFTKFLIDRQGEVVKRYSPMVSPQNMEVDIKHQLNSM
ncbi:glutathione peroxidase [Bacillus sp. FSL K6-3431]|uniref:glutathione peroxidase n=1 Tax=Bacillus sp. FSL K6-3431 TaxID=2921500 RepID=UPI0030F8E144